MIFDNVHIYAIKSSHDATSPRNFIIEEDFHVVPIEVKSGKDYTVHSAINKVTNNDEYEVEKAYVFANCDVSVDGKFIYMPVYMCAFIEDHVELPILGKI